MDTNSEQNTTHNDQTVNVQMAGNESTPNDQTVNVQMADNESRQPDNIQIVDNQLRQPDNLHPISESQSLDGWLLLSTPHVPILVICIEVQPGVYLPVRQDSSINISLSTEEPSALRRTVIQVWSQVGSSLLTSGVEYVAGGMSSIVIVTIGNVVNYFWSSRRRL